MYRPPDWEPIMKIAGAIVTTVADGTCHAAIILQRTGIPVLLEQETGTSVLKRRGGSNITIDCSEGTGRIYEGC